MNQDFDLGIDLSDLGAGFAKLQALGDEPGSAAAGGPVELAIEDVVEDPDQVRKQFDPAALQELADSIRADKVRVPVSVKPRNDEGKYVINHGARRYRASILAGKTTIPGFIDASHDDYAQAVENIQRDNLTALEIARFIEKRRAAGDKDKAIGERLGKGKAYISQYASLLTWPRHIEALYNAGNCRDVTTLYNLIQLNKRAPAEVEKLCKTNSPVSRRDVSALEAAIAARHSSAANQRPETTAVTAGEGRAVAGDETSHEAGGDVASSAHKMEPRAAGGEIGGAVRKPVVLVSAFGEQASLLVTKRARYGHGWVKLQASGEEREVALSAVQIEAIIEG